MSDYNLIYSFGSMNEIASFFKPVEFLKLQALNRWMYQRGVCRTQVRFEMLFDNIAWFQDTMGKFTLIYYNYRSGECRRSASNFEDFFEKYALQVRDSLYTISYRDL